MNRESGALRPPPFAAACDRSAAAGARRTSACQSSVAHGAARRTASALRDIVANMARFGLLLLLLSIAPRLGWALEVKSEAEPQLAKLVRFFSKPGAFSQMKQIFGEEQSPARTSQSSCPDGDDGLECRRAEARRSVDCPRGDCYCYNCSRAGPELWASCCRESLKCCSHLAAACRTCDQPPLYPFCAKHFKKCLSQLNDKKPLLI